MRAQLRSVSARGLVVVLGYFVVGCATHANPPTATLCEIRMREELFDRKPVVVRATIFGDGERVVASDPHCPGKGAEVKLSERAIRDGYAGSLNDAITQSPFGTIEKTITATLTGTFLLNRSEGLVAELIVDRVDNLDVQRVPANR